MFENAFLRNVLLLLCFAVIVVFICRRVVIRENLTIDIKIREPKKVKQNKESPFVSASEAYDLASVNTGWAYPPFT